MLWVGGKGGESGGLVCVWVGGREGGGWVGWMLGCEWGWGMDGSNLPPIHQYQHTKHIHQHAPRQVPTHDAQVLEVQLSPGAAAVAEEAALEDLARRVQPVEHGAGVALCDGWVLCFLFRGSCVLGFVVLVLFRDSLLCMDG